jgi:two-component system, chemotaxis family, protein-glutamate methylesterase/glutaminase
MTTDQPFHTVGIGLSAGGLDPLLDIITELPGDAHAAFVVISHIPINTISKLDTIVAKVSALKVIPVSTIEYLEPRHIYVLTIGKDLVLADGFVQTRERNPNEKINKTIDVFFKSLAENAKDKSLGIILSGAGFDGIEGAHEIENQKGLVIVQDPETAQFPLMPNSLIAYDHPDYVLTPKEIAHKIVNHLQ